MATTTPIGLPPSSRLDLYIARYLYAQIHPSGPENLNSPALASILSTLQSIQDGIVRDAHTLGVLRSFKWFPPFALVCLVLSLGSTLARLGLRVRSRGWRWKAWSADDWFIIPATVFVVCGQCFCYIRARNFTSETSNIMTYKDMYYIFYYGVISFPMFFLASAFTKISIACYMRRVAGKGALLPNFRIFMNVLLAALVIYAAVSFFLSIFACGNPHYRFDITWAAQQPHRLHCISTVSLNLGLSTIHIILDVALFLAGLYLWRKIHTAWTRKASLGFLFLLASGSIGFSVARLYYDHTLWKYGGLTVVQIDTYTVLDNATALWIANIPALYTYIYTTLSALTHGNSATRTTSRTRYGARSTELLTDDTASRPVSPRLFATNVSSRSLQSGAAESHKLGVAEAESIDIPIRFPDKQAQRVEGGEQRKTAKEAEEGVARVTAFRERI